MELYYHQTDGGAEYLCAKYHLCPNGHKEGDVSAALLRTDGGELEIFSEACKKYGMKIVIS